jgi:hypothetical protein
MMSAATLVQPSISRTTEKIMPARLIDPAPPRASELPAPSAAPARPANEDAGQGSRAIIPGDDPGDQQPPQIDTFAIEAHITTTTTAVK